MIRKFETQDLDAVMQIWLQDVYKRQRLHRSLHRAVQHRVEVPHRRVGEALASVHIFAHAPAVFQPPVHPLHVLRRDERNLLAAELRLDVVFDIIPVSYTHLDVYKRQSMRRQKKPAAMILSWRCQMDSRQSSVKAALLCPAAKSKASLSPARCV